MAEGRGGKNMCTNRKKEQVTNHEIVKVFKTFTDNKEIVLKENDYKLNLQSTNKKAYKVTYLMDRDLSAFTCQGNVKYAMFVYSDEQQKDENLYIVIGQNPSHSFKSNIDRTNQNIFKAILNSNISSSRYILLNTFPIIDPDGASSPNELKLEDNIKVATTLIKKLCRLKCRMKIIYACGESLPVYVSFIKKINKLITKYKIKTYAFENAGRIQAHMSMQAINNKGLNIDDFRLVECNIDISNNQDFRKVKIIGQKEK